MNAAPTSSANTLPPLLKMAVLVGAETAVTFHLRNGGDVNATDNRGKSALILAVERGHPAICRLLLEAGADPTLQDDDCNDAISAAVKHNRPEIHAIIRQHLQLEQLEAGWEPVIEPATPPSDSSLLALSAVNQDHFAKHRPIDTAPDWSDVDVDLPDIIKSSKRRTRTTTVPWAIDTELLISCALREGWTTEDHLAQAFPRAKDGSDTSDSKYPAFLRIVLGDLGVSIYDPPNDLSFSQWAVEEARCHTETAAASEDIESNLSEAKRFFSDLRSNTSDPLAQYVRDVGANGTLSRDEETELAYAISNGIRAAISAMSGSPAAVKKFLDRIERLCKGGTSARSISGKHNNATVRAELNAIYQLCGSIANAQSVSEQRALTVDLRKTIVDLGIRNEFMERLLEEARASCQSRNIRDVMACSLDRVRKSKRAMAASNLRLVLWQARQYRGRPFMDLVQDGNIGLLRAIDRFDPDYGTRLSTYAVWWIRHSIQRGIANTDQLIRRPVHAHDQEKRIASVLPFLTAGLKRMPTVEELAREVDLRFGGVSESDVRRILRCVPEQLPTNELQEMNSCFEENTTSLNVPTPEDVATYACLQKTVRKMVLSLGERDARVIWMRFGLDRGRTYTLEEIGQLYNVTRERIRQIEARALKKLAHPSRAAILRPLLELFDEIGDPQSWPSVVLSGTINRIDR